MKPVTIDEYIASAPEHTRAKCQELRKIILNSAPKDTVEKLSYGMPYYSYKGRLIYWGAFKEHLGLYIMGASREAYAKEIKPYHKSKATLHFKIDEPLPEQLIAGLVKAQAEANNLRSR